MNSILNNKAFTLIEVIISLTILGIVIGPILNIFLVSTKINGESNKEYKSFLAAQMYLEEIKALDNVDNDYFTLNDDTGNYERIINQTNEEYGAEIKIIPESIFLYSIEIKIIDGNEVINILKGSKIINNKIIN